jgi:signal transduction histidine kinase
MKRASFLLSVFLGLAVVILSVCGFINLRARPGIPKVIPSGSVLRVDSFEVRNVRDLDFILGRKSIGDPAEIELRTDGGTEVVRTVLEAYYPRPPVIFLVIGGFAILIGAAVLFLRRQDPRARIFYWATLAFGASVMISGDLYGMRGPALPLLCGILFDFAYPLAPALLWGFTRTFSPRPEKTWFRFFWALPLAFGTVLGAGFLYSELRTSFEVYRFVQDWFFIFRLYIAAVCIAAVVELVRSYRTSVSDEVRAQIKWIFFGMTAGLSPFVFLYQLPLAVPGGGTELIGEDISTVFMLLVPVTLAISILKYRLMNINLVINRSLVYSLLTMFTVGVYLLAVEVLGRLFAPPARFADNWASLGAVVLAALAFEPGRRRIQLLVDKTFFRQTHDLRKAVLEFGTRAQKMLTPGPLVSEFAAAVGDVLPVEKLGVLVWAIDEFGPRPVYCEAMDGQAAGAFLSRQAPSGEAWAREEAVRTTRGIDFSNQDLLKTLGLDVALPLPFGPVAMAGWLAAGRKKSGQRFTGEELDFLATLAAELASGLARIRLQEEVVLERASRERADELNRLKTEFISSVSHELRTPMGSLQSLSELLGSGAVRDEARRERLLQLMAGECGRLSRFIHNVLDFGKIEQERKLYDLRSAPVQPLIREVLDLARSGAAAEEGLFLTTEMPDETVFLEADQDALRQALLNLLDNAIKYSEGPKEVTVRLVPGSDAVEIQVEDRGIGIEPEDRERIFEAFFRSPGAVLRNPKGVGLGLKIVKHIMDAHGGRVELRSAPGRGSTFSLIFPQRRPS